MSLASISLSTIPWRAPCAAFALLAWPALAVAGTCTPEGRWTEAGGGPVEISAALTGTMKLPYCDMPHQLAIIANGTAGFDVTATYSSGLECQGFRETMTFIAACSAVSGTYINDDGSSGAHSWTRAGPTIALTRTSLTGIQVSGTPSGGTYVLSTKPVSGGNHALITPTDAASTTPNNATLDAPAHSGAPSAGGIETLVASYTAQGAVATNNLNRIATFGMSCYMVALQSDYGSAPDSCSSTTIYGTRWSGALVNPNGLTGTYCASFIANVKLQGTGQLNDGTYINYGVNTRTMTVVPSVTGADNTPVVAGRTLARDRGIIPGRGVLVDVSGVGTGLLANDTGGAIRGYRLDLFNGAGRDVCANYANPIGVGACQTAQGTSCPASELK